MNKNSSKKVVRYVVSWETHPKNLLKNFCSLMEHQSLVDVVMCCGNNTIQAHKFVLAANSPLFREEFEKNPSVEQILIGGCEFSVLKSVVEIMYCGQTLVNDDNVKFLIAVLKLFQMKHLENIFNEHPGANEDIYLPKPQFLTNKPKYPAFSYQSLPATSQNPTSITTCAIARNIQPNCSLANSGHLAVAVVNGPAPSSGDNILKPLDFNVPLTEPIPPVNFKSYVKGKRTLKQQAEQACVKEAQASRLALACLQKEIAAAPQINSFIIEDTCTETTVENFIPHAETAPYVNVLNYNGVGTDEDFDNAMFLPVPASQTTNSAEYPEIINQTNHQPEKRVLTADKLKYILGPNMPANVEVMYKDAEGNFVPVNEEVLQTLFAKEGLQYQVVDEQGRVSDLQEINKIDKLVNTVLQQPCDNNEMANLTKPTLEVSDYLNETEDTLSIKPLQDNMCCSMISTTGETVPLPAPVVEAPRSIMELPSLEESQPQCEFSPEMFFSEIISPDVQGKVTVTDDDVFIESGSKNSV